ncbi:hypothetical protein PG996_011792 [Apiospora saccharicola]|uniref:FeS cluster biogenesis domain-containing protein n=1 Tax=Apiospora saccharicola TaxID=335842 RepID=A0ABR1UG22_9PEZI
MRSRCTNPASAARLFVQLSRTCAQQPSQRAPLDILLPASTRSFHSGLVPRSRITSPISSHRSRSTPTSSPKRTTAACTASTTTTRSFGSTSARQMTQAIYNPQKDEDGNDMVLEITPRAANVSPLPNHGERQEPLPRPAHPSRVRRLPRLPVPHVPDDPPVLPALGHQHDPGRDAPSPAATAEAGENSTTTGTAASEPGVGEEDTVFAFVKEGDNLSANQQGEVDSLAAGPKIVLDAPSLELLKGSKVDYTMELIGSQFKIVDNPLASSSCGCGTSFDIKV